MPNNFLHAVASHFEDIPIDYIFAENRQREDLGDLTQLKATINQLGLIEPIVVQQTDNGYRLIAGERRLTAFKELGRTTIPAGIVKPDASAEALEAIELYENIARKQLSYDEEARAYARMAVYIEKSVQTDKLNRRGEAISSQEVASILGVSAGHLSESKKLAAVMEVAPDFKKMAKNRSDALNLLAKMSKQSELEEKVQVVQAKRAETSEKDEKDKLMDAYVIADAFDHIKQQPDGQFAFFDFDPPYAIGHDDRSKNKTAASMLSQYMDMTPSQYTNLISSFAPELYRVATQDAWLVCWTGVYGNPADKSLPPWFWFETCYKHFSIAGWHVDPVPAVWYKEGRASIRQDAQTQLSMQTEMFLVCRKGNATLTTPGRPNVYAYSPLFHKYMAHKAEKPIRLYTNILRTFASPGDSLYAPFCGSGNILLAGANYGCDVLGCDVSKDYKPHYLLHVMEESFGRYKDKDGDDDAA